MFTTAPSCASTALAIKDTNSPTRPSTIAGSSMSDMPVNPRISANRITSGERSGLSASLAATSYTPLSHHAAFPAMPAGPTAQNRNFTQAVRNGRGPPEYTYYSNVISSSRRAEYNFFIPVRSTGILTLNSGPETPSRRPDVPARYQDGGRKWLFA